MRWHHSSGTVIFAALLRLELFGQVRGIGWRFLSAWHDLLQRLIELRCDLLSRCSLLGGLGHFIERFRLVRDSRAYWLCLLRRLRIRLLGSLLRRLGRCGCDLV
ncbi:MAG: hypothetical protein BGN89_06565 [Alphaproteobacteria bacterium 64-6]|nr:MAG: hypothetical protein BGN89_06565 [Alphaproteobacteria bacterium 64-6]